MGWGFLGISAAAGLVVASTSGAAAMQHHDSTPAAVIATGPTDPRQAFSRGLQLLHNFEYGRAQVAFREAQAADPDNVMPYWGEAMTYNHPLWMEQDSKAARAALSRLGPTEGARSAKARTPRERGMLEAVEALYGAGTKIERDHAYARRMEVLFAADPSDVDVRAFTALSIMGLAHDGRDPALYMRAAAMLEEVFPVQQSHPGVLHYLIHAYDDPDHAPLGRRAARLYAAVAPDAGHAIHMTSHIYLALGEWEAVERANVAAMATVNQQRAARNRPPSRCGHTQEWLVYALLQQGKDAGAELGGCGSEASAEVGGGKDGAALGASRSNFNSWADMAMRAAVETGRAPGAMAVDGDRFLLGQFMLAYADLFVADAGSRGTVTARSKMAALLPRIARALPVERPDDTITVKWLERAMAQADALAELAEGRDTAGLDLLRKAHEAEKALPVEYGPPALGKPSAELLGDLLLARGRKTEAAEAYARALAAAPGRRRALAGLKAAQGE